MRSRTAAARVVLAPSKKLELGRPARQRDWAGDPPRLCLEAIAEQEARHRALFAALSEPILTTSADGRVADFNPAAAEMFGDPRGLYGRPVLELLPFVAAPGRDVGQVCWQGRAICPADRVQVLSP